MVATNLAALLAGGAIDLGSSLRSRRIAVALLLGALLSPLLVVVWRVVSNRNKHNSPAQWGSMKG